MTDTPKSHGEKADAEIRNGATTQTLIPSEPLDVNWAGAGLPIPMLRKHKGKSCQEASHWLLAWAVCACIATVAAIMFSKLDTPLKCIAAGIPAFGCMLYATIHALNRKYGQKVEMDPANETLRITREGLNLPVLQIEKLDLSLNWKDVIGLQTCHSKRDDENTAAYDAIWQLNLVWREKTGEVKRHCLAISARKKPIDALTAEYRRTCGFKLLS